MKDNFKEPKFVQFRLEDTVEKIRHLDLIFPDDYNSFWENLFEYVSSKLISASSLVSFEDLAEELLEADDELSEEEAYTALDLLVGIVAYDLEK